MAENNTGTPRPQKTGFSATGLSPADYQRINQTRMYVAQQQYSCDMENANIGRSNALNMGYVPRHPPPSYFDAISQPTPSSFASVSTVSQSTSDNYTSSSMQQCISESNDNLAVSQSTSQVTTNNNNDDQKRVDIRHQLLLEVLAQIDAGKSKADVAKRELNSDSGVAFDWGRMPRIGSVYSVQGIVESSPALAKQNNSTPKSLSFAEKDSTPKEQSLPTEQIAKMSKINVTELARLILSGAFDGLLTNSTGNRNDQGTANNKGKLNQTQVLTQAPSAPPAPTRQFNNIGIDTQTSIQEPMNDRLLTVIANKIIGSYNQQSQSGNVEFGQRNYTAPSQFAHYNQRAYASANNSTYERSVASGHVTTIGNVQSGSQVRNCRYVVTQSHVTPFNQSHPTNANQNSMQFGSRGPAAYFSRNQVVHQGQRGTANQRFINAFNQSRVNQGPVGSSQAPQIASQRSMAIANQSRLETRSQRVVNPVNQGHVRSSTNNLAYLQRLRNANIERFHRELSRWGIPGQSYPSTSNQARTARVFPIVSRILSSPSTTARKEAVKTTDQNLLETPHDPISCIDCLLLGTCPIAKSAEASKNKEKESIDHCEDDIVITKVTTKDAERGPIERIDVDDWVKNASSLPERITIKEEPVDETSCSTSEKESEVNSVEPAARLSTQSTQPPQQTAQEIELLPVDETPVYFPVTNQSENLSATVSPDENLKTTTLSKPSTNRNAREEKADTCEVEKANDIGVGTVERVLANPIVTSKSHTGEQFLKKQFEEASLEDNEPSTSALSQEANDVHKSASMMESTMSRMTAFKETSDGKEQYKKPENAQVHRSYNDVLREVMGSKDKILLAEMEKKLEDNSNKLKTQTVPWIKKNILKARLQILKRIEKIRNKYEFQVQIRFEKHFGKSVDVEKEHDQDVQASKAQECDDDRLSVESSSTEKKADQSKEKSFIDKGGSFKKQDDREEAAENTPIIEVPFRFDIHTQHRCESTHQDTISGIALEPPKINSEVQVYEEGDQVGDSTDADVIDQPMTLEEAIKSLDDIPLPDEERARKKELGYTDVSDITDCSRDSNERLNRSIRSDQIVNKIECNRDESTVNRIENNISNEEKKGTDNRNRSSAITLKDLSCSIDNVTRISCRNGGDSNVKDTESTLGQCTDLFLPSLSTTVLSPVDEQRISTDNIGASNIVSNNNKTKATQVKHVQNCELKTVKRKSLDGGEGEMIKKIKKEKTGGTSSFNIWERLNTKYSFY